jgi:hypothetical protein
MNYKVSGRTEILCLQAGGKDSFSIGVPDWSSLKNGFEQVLYLNRLASILSSIYKTSGQSQAQFEVLSSQWVYTECCISHNIRMMSDFQGAHLSSRSTDILGTNQFAIKQIAEARDAEGPHTFWWERGSGVMFSKLQQ